MVPYGRITLRFL